jgi:hypothetical protein
MRSEGLSKFKNSPYRVSNPQPSGLQHSAISTTLPRVTVTNFVLHGKEIFFLTSRTYQLLERPCVSRCLFSMKRNVFSFFLSDGTIKWFPISRDTWREVKLAQAVTTCQGFPLQWTASLQRGTRGCCQQETRHRLADFSCVLTANWRTKYTASKREREKVGGGAGSERHCNSGGETLFSVWRFPDIAR